MVLVPLSWRLEGVLLLWERKVLQWWGWFCGGFEEGKAERVGCSEEWG